MMTLRKTVALITLVAIVALSGCATVMYDARSLGMPASLGEAGSTGYTVLSSFEINDKAAWVLGLVPANKPAGDNQDYLATLLAEEIRKAGGDAVINVTLRTQTQPLDILVSIVTLGIYPTRTATITGDVIRFD
jgi:hypothetical protein